VEHVHLAPQDWQLLERQISRLVVIRKSLIVPHITLELIFSFLAFVLLSREAFVFFLFFVKIAFVVATGGRAMIFPAARADPAELVAALVAGHVVAPLVLLDWPVAARAVFRVCHDPRHILRLCTHLHVPLVCCVAIAWLMRW